MSNRDNMTQNNTRSISVHLTITISSYSAFDY